MSDPVGDQQDPGHCLADWLALHDLNATTCRRLLEAAPTSDGAAPEKPEGGYLAPDLETTWLRVAEAMREFLPEQQNIIDDTFHHTARITVDHSGTAGKALTLDNGPTAYPTILINPRNRPSDCLLMAHEFGHALQITASRGKFVPPVMREVCAFLAEAALLSHTLDQDAQQHAHLAQAWQSDSRRYFGKQKDRLALALSEPATPYRYSWNYPIARYFTIGISGRCSRHWIWRLFGGDISVRDALGILSFPSE